MKTWSSSWLIVAGTCLLTASGAEAGSKAPVPVKPALNGGESSVYVQTASRGTFKPAGKGSPDEYVLTLQGVSGSTVYFSNGTQRAAGSVATEELLSAFLAGGGPPTASINPSSPGGQGVVVQLTDPRYDARRGTLTYRAKVLGDQKPLGGALSALPASFDAVSVFLHFGHCGSAGATCWGGPSGPANCPTACGALSQEVGYCWSWSSLSCQPCRDYGYLCSEENICGSLNNGPECRGSCSTYHQPCGGG